MIVGKNTYIRVAYDGKESFQSFNWWIKMMSFDDHERYRVDGFPFYFKYLGEIDLIVLAPKIYYPNAPIVELGISCKVKFWDLEKEKIRYFTADRIKKGAMLDGVHGAFVVGEVQRVRTHAWRTNAPCVLDVRCGASWSAREEDAEDS